MFVATGVGASIFCVGAAAAGLQALRISRNISRAIRIKRIMATINAPRDPNTLSNYNNWRTEHTVANFEILFDDQRLKGNVLLTLRSITDAETKEIVLDTSYLDVSDVKVGDQSCKWQLLPRFEPYGSALKILLETAIPRDETVIVQAFISTTKQCTALQWLTPAQTSNKKHPYMFSQCQAIHARSIYPCQDTPDVKSTFEFNITSPLPVIASGLADDSTPATTGKTTTYKFTQNVPMPSYLFALASGDITQASIGPISKVAASPDSLASCKWELEADMDRYIQAAEKIVYPYAWGTYNVLVLPPSFPYGGMENPIYTFATPTIISGDRQNVDVIAHELSHSWSGNLVSNASWEHFWLNEGWTTYLERRIQWEVHGGEAWRDFSAIIGWKALSDSVAQFGEEHEFTKLIVDLKGQDPDDAFSSIPYEKGFVFLYTLEKMLGIAKFDKFIPYYFTKWKGKSLDSYDFKATILEFFATDEQATKLLTDLDWDTWFYKPGYPPKPDFDTTLVDVVYDLVDRFKHDKYAPGPDDIEGLLANQLVVLLEAILLFEKPISADLEKRMGDAYGFSKSKNVELTSRYYQVAMKAGDLDVLPEVVNLLGQVGRMKFVRPLYRGLIKLDRPLAEKTFKENEDFYHPICKGMVEKILYGNKN